MVMQRSSWADEEIVNLEQVHNAHGRPRVRQRRGRRGGAAPRCQMANSTDDAQSGCWERRVLMRGPADTSNKKVSKQAEPLNLDADLQALLESPERCKDVVARLSSTDPDELHELLIWLQPVLRHLSLIKAGCRIVQKAFEVSGANGDRDLIIAQLKDHVVELYESPHGNFVLSKAIEVLPAAKNGFILSALRGRGVAVSKHRFGCRVVCRLMEHCTEEQIGPLLDEILPEVAMLARDEYGNYIVQAALEHASPCRQLAIQQQLLPGFASLALHKDGSRVAERLLDYCAFEQQQMAIHTLLQAPQAEDETSLVEIACDRYGSYVIAHLIDLQHKHAEVCLIAGILGSHLQLLQASQYAERVIIAFGLAPVQEQLSYVTPS